MDKRIAALIGLSILVVLAGCNGATGPQSSPNTSSGPEQNQMDRPKSVYNGVRLPNGTTPTRINETEVLATQHSLLSSQDYRIGINLTHAAGGRIANTTTIISSNRSHHQLYLQSDLPGRTLEEYYTANRSLSRTEIGNETAVRESEVDSFEAVHEREARSGDLLTALLTAAEFTAVNTTTIEDHDAIIYNVTGVSGSNSSRFPPEIEQFKGSMTIDDRGLVRNVRLTTLGVRNGTVEAMVQEYQTLKYGDVQVEEPAWVKNQS